MKKITVLIVLSILLLGWLVCILISIFTKSPALSVSAFVLLASSVFIMGANAGPSNIPVEKKTLKEKWASVTLKEKVTQILSFVLLPPFFFALYVSYFILLEYYFGPLNFQQKLIYSFVVLNLNTMLPVFIGMGVKRWIPAFARKLNYV